MKTKTLMLGLVSFGLNPFTGGAFALTPFSDNFNAPKLNTDAWTPGGEGGAKLKQTNGVLRFLVPKNKEDEDYAFLELKGIYPGYNESWQVIVDVTNTNEHRGNSAPGFWISSGDDPSDVAFFEFYGKGPKGGFIASFTNNGVYNVGPDLVTNPGVTKGSLKITFSKTTKIITFWHDKTGSSNGYQWVKLGTFSTNGVGGNRRADWLMNEETSYFTVRIFGFSEGKIVAAGTETLDNFSVKSLK